MNEEATSTNTHTNYKFFARGIKLEFLQLSGLHPPTWIYRANQSFFYHKIPPGQIILSASFHMKDWHLPFLEGILSSTTSKVWIITL